MLPVRQVGVKESAPVGAQRQRDLNADEAGSGEPAKIMPLVIGLLRRG